MHRRQFVQGALVLPLLSRVLAADQQDSFAAVLLALARTYCEASKHPGVLAFLDEWPGAGARAVMASTLPVLKYQPALTSHCAARERPLVDELFRISSRLAWRQSYPAQSVGQNFLDNYGYAEIAGLSGPIPSQHLALGFLILGPEVLYPKHRHEAQEVYIPLSGSASWQGGDGTWRTHAPGTVIIHARHEPHAMRTEARTPLLALYLWRSSELNQKSQLDPR